MWKRGQPSTIGACRKNTCQRADRRLILPMARKPTNFESYIVPAIIQRSYHRCEKCGVGNGWRGYWHGTTFHPLNGSRAPQMARVIKIKLDVIARDYDFSNNHLMNHRAPAPPLNRSNLLTACQRCMFLHEKERPVKRRRSSKEQTSLQLELGL